MRRILVSAIALAIAGTALNAPAQAPVATAAVVADATTQLPRDVRPTHYDIAVVPHADTLAFDGKATITLDVLQPTDRIVLNAIDMAFPSATLTPVSGAAALPAPKVAIDAAAQTATFSFDRPLAVGSYRLALDYSGRIGTQANGLFAIDYDTASGKRRALYTQFENSDARRFIPSWDEPNHKATFTLTATVPAAQMAVSNMPVADTTDLGNGLKRVRFARSPKMSTYLLFFGLGDFDRTTTMADGVEVGVVTQKGKAGQSQFALDSAAAVLKEYNDYFGVPYPLPKLDNIASPGRSQFFSAMENWGAIYTFEYAQLLDPSISTQRDMQNVFTTAAHEIAHQWFGDLVTMSWWDDLWLNEGFASWLEGRTTEKLHPEWNTALSAVGVREAAMGLDAVATTHPVVQHVETVEQASQAFDSITYSKGEAVIRMLEGYVGSDAWRDGVRSYIKAHAYGNTVSDDLWNAIEAAARKPITKIAHDFTLQPGVPMIRVESAQCSGGNTTLQLVQGEFTRDRPDKAPLSWQVPVIAQALGGVPARTLVAGGKATLQVPGCDPVVVNAGQSGYYRTLYAPAQFQSLRAAFARLAPIDQLGLMNDAWALGMAGLQPASDYLDLASVVPAGADPQIWGDVADSLGGLDDYYRGDDARQSRFRKFAIATLAPVFARVGWEAMAGEADPIKNLRVNLIGTLGGLGDADIIAEARRRYAASASDAAAMPPALKRTILAVVARHADAATWDKLHAAARAETTPLVKDQLYALLATPEDAALAQRALDLALTEEPGATNSAGMLSIVSGGHPDLAFDFAVAHKAEVDRRVDSTSRSRYYPGLGSRSRDPAMIAKLDAFADAHIAKGSRRATDTAIASIQYRRMVIEKRLPQVTAWLARQSR
ncbi:ERAP1-like C-terminal domain-containing protein [Luteimonas sp. 50]|uniref:Aminopeptidase n=1 Tax=Cognatiluteimonas sedimenti TaxID=2927791 RepID=A0ABT0A2L9_9GAMM|nr:M1 family metallopeptidase [Lysobacter sedimenti]MCJ0825237.1 ERAP1-like C-terminal domain-containing protein [Lysobacter sedimenti]